MKPAIGCNGDMHIWIHNLLRIQNPVDSKKASSVKIFGAGELQNILIISLLVEKRK